MVTEVKRHQGSWPLTHRPRTYIGVGDRKDDTANYAVEDWSWLVQPPTQLFAILDQDKTSRLQQYIRYLRLSKNKALDISIQDVALFLFSFFGPQCFHRKQYICHVSV